MSYAYYPGCTLHSSARDYDQSLKAICSLLGIQLEEIDDWNCCGATAAPSVDPDLALTLVLRNLARAEKKHEELVTACNACYLALRRATERLEEYPRLKDKMEENLQAAGLSYRGKVTVRHLLELVVSLGPDVLLKQIKKPLAGLKVACYYGCQLVRPRYYDDPEDPQSLDKLVELMGATAVPFRHKAKCCAASLATTKEKVALKMIKDILQDVHEAGAQLIVTICPMCQMNLDAYQDQINAAYGLNLELPVVYFTQLLGLAFGLDSRQLGLDKPVVSPKRVLASFL